MNCVPPITMLLAFFFFNDTATTEIYTLSLHDALPILAGLEPFTVTEDSLFVNVGERTNITGSAKFRNLIDRKSTRLNSSHANISYAVFCLKKKKQENCTTKTAVSESPRHGSA